MSHARFDKPCGADPALAIERVVRHLIGVGYAVELHTSYRAELVYMQGTVSAARLDQQRHKLEIVADGKQLSFHFHGKGGAASQLSKKERAALDARSQKAAEAAQDSPPPPPIVDSGPEFHCRYCRGLTPSNQPNCRHCGAENFG